MNFEEELELKQVLGEGATAVLFEAEDEQGNRYCIKRYKTGLAVKDKERVLREIQLLTKLDHAQIPRIYGHFVKEMEGRKLLHVVQEYIDGEDLSIRMEKEALELDAIHRLLFESLQVLVYLHDLTPAIIHRDIKPANLMLGSGGQIILIDFGQAIDDIYRTYGQTLVTGTLGYQAPEQIYGETVAKSDVYSLGVVAIELLTQKKPSSMLEGQSLRWERYCRKLPLEVQEWLDGVLHPDINKRWSARKALEELARIRNIFVQAHVPGASPSIASGVSEGFLNILDAAIIDEEEEKRKERQEKHRNQVVVDRRKQRDEALWREMENSWYKLLKTIESGRLSKERGMMAFLEGFEQTIADYKEELNGGEIDYRIGMLLDVAKGGSLEALSVYQKWVEKTFLTEEISALATILKKIRKLEPKKDRLRNTLEKMSWLEGVFFRRLEQRKLDAIEAEIEECCSQKEELNQKIKKRTRLYFAPIGMDQKAQITVRIHSLNPMNLVPKGDFLMGAIPGDHTASLYEKPRHEVRLTKDYWVGIYPVTQELWDTVMKNKLTYAYVDMSPVVKVTWLDCIQFCNRLSVLEGFVPVYDITGETAYCNWEANGYRLLTEAEWERAARGGEYHLLAGKHSATPAMPVGRFKPNGYGLYDMTGNINETCWDWFDPNIYEREGKELRIDPRGAETKTRRLEGRVYRGGSRARVSERGFCKAGKGYRWIGFRIARNA